MASQAEPKTIDNCRHCGVPVGQIEDPWGGKHGWKHHYDAGPDAYVFCLCKCEGCTTDSPNYVLCCDGEQAEPDPSPTSPEFYEGSLIDGLVESVAKCEGALLASLALPFGIVSVIAGMAWFIHAAMTVGPR